tara:strand:- start:3732 stop:4517 length:786 start_codon:yes stop_codon:yes gene_type:complete
MDGGSIFGIVPKAIWSKTHKPDRLNRVEIALNCLLIQTNNLNILIDTGIGNKHNKITQTRFHMRGGNLVKNLEYYGLYPNDIDYVILTHLHFDHVGGCTTYEGGKLVPVFPKATYLVQQRDWQEATCTNERTRTAYIEEDFLPLNQTNQLELLNGDTEIISRLWVRHTGGHTDGHQMVYFESDGEKIACLGDILMIPQQIPVPYITSYDLYPTQTFDAKRYWLKKAREENWLLILGHGTTEKSGYLYETNGKTIFASIEVI